MSLYTETWWRIWCSECDTPNWVCGGDMNDMSQIDIEGFECWKCEHECCLYDEEEQEDMGLGPGLQMHCVQGRESPITK